MRIRLTGVAVAMALSATAAAAADDGAAATRGAKPASSPIAFSWLDPYVGGNLGDREHASERRSDSSRSTFSTEADPRFSNAGDTFANYKFANPWLGSGSGRGGIALDNVLFAPSGSPTAGGTSRSPASLRTTSTLSPPDLTLVST
jgi:outer membrane immunogenic protein